MAAFATTASVRRKTAAFEQPGRRGRSACAELRPRRADMTTGTPRERAGQGGHRVRRMEPGVHDVVALTSSGRNPARVPADEPPVAWSTGVDRETRTPRDAARSRRSREHRHRAGRGPSGSRSRLRTRVQSGARRAPASGARRRRGRVDPSRNARRTGPCASSSRDRVMSTLPSRPPTRRARRLKLAEPAAPGRACVRYHSTVRAMPSRKGTSTR